MTVTSVDKDFDDLTLTLVADFDAPIERVWQLWADPRQAGALVGAARPTRRPSRSTICPRAGASPTA